MAAGGSRCVIQRALSMAHTAIRLNGADAACSPRASGRFSAYFSDLLKASRGRADVGRALALCGRARRGGVGWAVAGECIRDVNGYP